MNFRKNRVPLQGVTNFRKTDVDWSKSKKNVWTPIEQVRARNHETSENASSIQKINHTLTKNRKLEVQSCVDSRNNKALLQIRKAYKNTENVWRMAKAWQFSKRGFITLQQLKQRMEKVIGISFTSQELQSIGEKYGNQEKKIDIKNFLSLAYGESQASTYKPKLFNILDRNKFREQKIDNLVDKLDIYEPALNKNRNHESQASLTTACLYKNQLKKSDFSSIKKQYRRKSIGEQKSLGFSEFNKQQFQRLNQQSFKSLKQSVRDNSMHPNLMLNLDQTKTRFGATTCNAFRNNQNCIFRQQSDKTFAKQEDITLRERTQKKLKMLNRIEKIRQMEKKQKQNIDAREDRQMQREDARIYRKKLDREAYEYSSFIRNKWL